MIFGLVISRARLATKADLQELFEKIIMPTQKEIADGLEAVRQELSDVSTELGKVSQETDSLNNTITDLKNVIDSQGSNASPELVAAFAAVKAQADVVAAGVKAVDDKVPDAPTATLPPA